MAGVDGAFPETILLSAVKWIDSAKPAAGLRTHAQQRAPIIGAVTTSSSGGGGGGDEVSQFVATHGVDHDARSARGVFVKRRHFPMMPVALGASSGEGASSSSPPIERMVVLTEDIAAPTAARPASVEAESPPQQQPTPVGAAAGTPGCPWDIPNGNAFIQKHAISQIRSESCVLMEAMQQQQADFKS